MMEVLLKGMVGSQAYGMATPTSDEDWYGVFAYPTFDLVGLHQPKLTVEDHKPDLVMHEAGKYAKLALGCNPTVLELLYLPEYAVATDLGMELVSIRETLLSARRVRDAFLGYATQQFKRITMRGDNSFSSDTRHRTAKHARHLYRLCEQGYQLYSKGTMQLKVAGRESIFEFGEQIANGELHRASGLLSGYARLFDECTPALPKNPNETPVARWLLKVRARYSGWSY